jgi:rhodanese-related sulfurtransferase
MKVVIYAVLLIGAMLLAIFFLGERSRAQKGGGSMYHKITAEEAREKMQNTKDFILLDVRTPEEFSEQHLPGAILLTDIRISAEAEEKLPNKDTPIFVYCRSGRRSAGAANQLVNIGYTQIYDFGGIIDWPYETVSRTEQQ